MKNILCLLLIIFLTKTAQAQQVYKIKGRILDINAAASLPGAACALLQKKDSSILKGSSTDANGNFEIDKVEPGYQQLPLIHMARPAPWWCCTSGM